MYTPEPLSHLPEPQWLLDDPKLLSWWQNLLYIAEHDRLRRDYPGLFYVRTYDLAASWTRRDIYGMPEDDKIEEIAQFLRRLEADGIITIEYGLEPCTYSEITIIPAPKPKASAQTKNSASDLKTIPANILKSTNAANKTSHNVVPQTRRGRHNTTSVVTRNALTCNPLDVETHGPCVRDRALQFHQHGLMRQNEYHSHNNHLVGPNGRFGRQEKGLTNHIVGPNGRFGLVNALQFHPPWNTPSRRAVPRCSPDNTQCNTLYINPLRSLPLILSPLAPVRGPTRPPPY